MPKFTRETARAAAAKRYRRQDPDPRPGTKVKDQEPAPAPGVDEPVPLSFHGGLPPLERAAVEVTPPPTEQPPIETPTADPAPSGDEPGSPSAAPTIVEVTSTPFTPEIVEMFANIGFDLVGAVSGRPHIWKLDEDEIKPIAPSIGRQLQRIPIIRALGPDNTELMIVFGGLGVIVTKRLNEHADEVQHEREAKAARARGGDAAAAGDIAPRSSPAAAARRDDGFASEGGLVHIGMRH